MGEVAEMMLDGTLCAGCGDLLINPDDDEEPAGFPQFCPSCQPVDRDYPVGTEDQGRGVRDTPCPHCLRKCRGEQGLAAHIRAKHPRAQQKEGE